MKKTLVLSLENLKIKGDILDITKEKYGVIYNVSKDIDDEICVDSVEGESGVALKNRVYDACTFFFNLNNIPKITDKAKMIEDITAHIKSGGEVYIWDINKNFGEIVNSNLKVILPNGDIKEYKIKNNNIFISSNIEENKKLLEKNYKIEETKVWEDIHFIKATKI